MRSRAKLARASAWLLALSTLLTAGLLAAQCVQIHEAGAFSGKSCGRALRPCVGGRTLAGAAGRDAASAASERKGKPASCADHDKPFNGRKPASDAFGKPRTADGGAVFDGSRGRRKSFSAARGKPRADVDGAVCNGSRVGRKPASYTRWKARTADGGAILNGSCAGGSPASIASYARRKNGRDARRGAQAANGARRVRRYLCGMRGDGCALSGKSRELHVARA